MGVAARGHARLCESVRYTERLCYHGQVRAWRQGAFVVYCKDGGAKLTRGLEFRFSPLGGFTGACGRGLVWGLKASH